MSAINIDPKDLRSLALDVDMSIKQVSDSIEALTSGVNVIEFGDVANGSSSTLAHGFSDVPRKTLVTSQGQGFVTYAVTKQQITVTNSSGSLAKTVCALIVR